MMEVSYELGNTNFRQRQRVCYRQRFSKNLQFSAIPGDEFSHLNHTGLAPVGMVVKIGDCIAALNAGDERITLYATKEGTVTLSGILDAISCAQIVVHVAIE